MVHTPNMLTLASQPPLPSAPAFGCRGSFLWMSLLGRKRINVFTDGYEPAVTGLWPNYKLRDGPEGVWVR